MRRFIKNLFAFTGFFVILLICFHLVLMRLRVNYLRMPEGINKVFWGNSTVEYGVDDSFIPGAVNFAQNGEPIDIMYAKLKLLSRNNPQLDTVFVEFDDITLYNKDLVPVVSNAIYLDVFDVEDWLNNVKHYNFDRLTKYFSHSYDIIKLRPLFQGILNKEKKLIDLGVGGYIPLYRDKLDIDISRQNQGNSTKKVENIPLASIYYYHKIIDFGRDNNFKIIFFNTPKHRSVWGDDKYREFWFGNFGETPLFDFTNMILPDSCFGDAVHLNHIGARSFSDSLRTYIYR